MHPSLRHYLHPKVNGKYGSCNSSVHCQELQKYVQFVQPKKQTTSILHFIVYATR